MSGDGGVRQLERGPGVLDADRPHPAPGSGHEHLPAAGSQ